MPPNETMTYLEPSIISPKPSTSGPLKKAVEIEVESVKSVDENDNLVLKEIKEEIEEAIEVDEEEDEEVVVRKSSRTVKRNRRYSVDDSETPVPTKIAKRRQTITVDSRNSIGKPFKLL